MQETGEGAGDIPKLWNELFAGKEAENQKKNLQIKIEFPTVTEEE